jgi:2-hydroxy-6-oxonona-2,4-dienedioate hydrolase
MIKRAPIAAFVAGATGLVAGAAVRRAYRLELAERHRQLAFKGRVARTGHGPNEYASDGTGQPVLFIHGAGGGFDQGLAVASGLFPRHQVIAPSRFGYLGTPLPQDASPAAQADAHAALLDAISIRRAIVAGVSAGGPSAVEFALRHPERVAALILLVPMGYAPDHTAGVPSTPANEMVLRIIYAGADFLYWAALRVARRTLVRFMGVEPSLEAQAPPAERQRIASIMAGVLPLSRRLAGLRNDASIALHPLPLDRISAPTLIITARDDLYNTLPAAAHLADRIPSSKLVVLEHGGHLLVDQHQTAESVIADFLKSNAR